MPTMKNTNIEHVAHSQNPLGEIEREEEKKNARTRKSHAILLIAYIVTDDKIF